MEKPVIKISVVSDVVCPWCYIGKRRLEKAIENVSDKYEFEIEYLPFELNPQMPVEGRNQKEYLSQKFGSVQRYEQITAQTTAVAASEGLSFDFSKQAVSPNTRKAHQLIAAAKMQGKQLELVEALFKAYFSDGVNLSDEGNLRKIAIDSGLPEELVNLSLTNHTFESQVRSTEDQLQQLGISGVPFYIVNDKYGISGAQAPETFLEVFAEIEGTRSPASVSGDACDVDAKNC